MFPDITGVAIPKSSGGKMFDFRRVTVFLLETPLLKAQNA